MKIGTIGSNFIVDAFFYCSEQIEGVEVKAVYSRSEERAKEFAAGHNVEKYYWDLEAFLSDEELDFIYVASPNDLHYYYSYEAMQHNKNVICEKPFVPTYEEAKKLYALAEEKGLYIFEAITVPYYPNFSMIRNNLERLGQIRLIQANFSQYSSRYDQLLEGKIANVFSPEHAGGALADINIYNLHFVMSLFGMPIETHYFANKHENGIDLSGILIMKYPGFLCELSGAKDSASKPIVQIQGEKGYITVNSQSSVLHDFEVVIPKEKSIERYNDQKEIHGIYYELLEFKNIYELQDHNSCMDKLKYSLDVVKVFEKARKDAGIYYANEKTA